MLTRGMTTLAPAQLTEQLRWRYATKRFDPTRSLSGDTWQALLHALQLTASSFGLQPWRFIVVDDQEVRRQIRAGARDQAQVTDAARLLVIQAHTDVDAAHVGAHADRIAAERGDEAGATFRQRVTPLITEKFTPEVRKEWALRQTYIALGQYLAAAAVLGVDTCPMEGFDKPATDRLLGHEATPWRSVVIVPTGYRAAEDPQAALPKVRFPLDQVVSYR